MKFIASNPHPKGNKIGDCVVRAISIAENKKWIDVYNELCAIGREKFNLPNSRPVYEEYLQRNGWTKQRMPKHENGRRMKLREFAETKPKGIYIASVVKHLTAVEDGVLLDTWDCSGKCIGNFFTK